MSSYIFLYPPPDDHDVARPAVTAFNASPNTSTVINRLWARHFVSALTQLASHRDMWLDADAYEARRQILAHLNTFITTL